MCRPVCPTVKYYSNSSWKKRFNLLFHMLCYHVMIHHKSVSQNIIPLTVFLNSDLLDERKRLKYPSNAFNPSMRCKCFTSKHHIIEDLSGIFFEIHRDGTISRIDGGERYNCKGLYSPYLLLYLLRRTDMPTCCPGAFVMRKIEVPRLSR